VKKQCWRDKIRKSNTIRWCTSTKRSCFVLKITIRKCLVIYLNWTKSTKR